MTDKANGRSPEESQEALLSAANTVKCVGEGPGRCRASRPGGGEHGRRERDQRPRRVWTRRSPGGVARAGPTRVAPVAPPGPSPPMSGPVPSRVEETARREPARKSCSTAPLIAALRTRIPARPVSDAAAWRDV